MAGSDARRTEGERQPRRTWALISGVVVLVVLLGAAVALWSAGGKRYDANISAFARAPVGCDTTLAFDAEGEFVLYLETTGVVETEAGDCDVSRRYAREPDGLPQPDLILLDPSGEEVDLDPTGGVDYDTGEFVGTAYRLVQIDTEGAHVLTVGETGGEPFAVAVGRDPRGGVALLRWMAVTAAITALVAGGALLAFGSRRQPATPSAPEPWRPDTEVGQHHQGWPLSPPGFPTPPPTTGAVAPAGSPPTRPDEPPASWAPPAPPAQ